jgi:hypothetical protein
MISASIDESAETADGHRFREARAARAAGSEIEVPRHRDRAVPQVNVPEDF